MPTSADIEQVRARAREDIEDYLAHKLVNPGRFEKAYFRYRDIERVWSDPEDIKRVLSPNLSSAQIKIIQSHHLRFLSILVYINAQDFLDKFHRHIFDPHNNNTLKLSDSRLPLGEDEVDFLRRVPLQRGFLTHQYLFIPEIIQESSVIKKIDAQKRLPFESEEDKVFSGAYGVVQKIGISSEHLENPEGLKYSSVRYVACKRFHSSPASSRLDSKREMDNLQILKESITSHQNIRVHIAIILRGDDHFILLPWADHLDLEIFLLEGHSPFEHQELYKFSTRFPNFQSEAVLNNVCEQMRNIAHALDWLHGGVTTMGEYRHKIRFAHMDLKPNNILIDNDNRPSPSAVGKWVLTDFGISAFKEDEDANDTKDKDDVCFLSVSDYVNHTINIPPRRNPGAYQPPEVEREQFDPSGGKKTAKEGSAGRRGDIWSFGCIFAEVVAFALGQTALVDQFRKVRKKGCQTTIKNDYFYEKIDKMLGTNRLEVKYCVRPCIEDWLRTLSASYTFPKSSIDCCVETLLRILVVDGEERPKARTLLKMMTHVSDHVHTARAAGGFPQNCPLEHSSPFSSPPTSNEPTFKLGPTPIPSIEIEHVATDNESRILKTPTQIIAPSPPEPKQDREDSLVFNPHSPQDEETAGLGIFTNPNPFKPPDEPHLEGEQELNQFPSRRRSHRLLHGVLLDTKTDRKVQKPIQISVALEGRKIISAYLCSNGTRVTYLSETKKSTYEIQDCPLTHVLSNTQQDVVKHELHHSWRSHPLPTNVNWKHVASEGDTLVAWGNVHGGGGGEKQVYIMLRSRHVRSDMSKFSWMPNLVTIAVSKRGSLAFVCAKSIHYAVASSASQIVFDSEQIRPKGSDHAFTHAAFNDDGSLLYAWEFGRPEDRLTVWRIDEDTKLVRPPDSEGSYESKQRGEPYLMTLLPYNTYHGCIIRDQNFFFPAQIRSTHRDSKQILEKKIVRIDGVVAVCIYGDNSLLAAEKGFRHTRIWERRIVGGSNHVIDHQKTLLVELKGTLDVGTQMGVFEVPGSEDLTIVICGRDGKIAIVPVKATAI